MTMSFSIIIIATRSCWRQSLRNVLSFLVVVFILPWQDQWAFLFVWVCLGSWKTNSRMYFGVREMIICHCDGICQPSSLIPSGTAWSRFYLLRQTNEKQPRKLQCNQNLSKHGWEGNVSLSNHWILLQSFVGLKTIIYG